MHPRNVVLMIGNWWCHTRCIQINEARGSTISSIISLL